MTIPTSSRRREVHWIRRAAAASVFVLTGVFLYLADTQEQPAATGKAAIHDRTGGSRVPILAIRAAAAAPPHRGHPGLEDAGVRRVVRKRSGHCSALAPADWSLSSNPQASTAELRSGDGGLYAGWGILAVDRGMEPYYGPLYGTPENSMAFLAQTILRDALGDSSGFRYTTPERRIDGAFGVREFRSARHKGLVYYRIYPQYGGNYIESMYFAIARAERWAQQRALVANVAASIRCTTRLRPPSGGYAAVGGRGGDGADGLSKSGYNKELGTEYMHSPTTGENYLVDSARDYINGPQGEGVYIRNGNDYIKLEPGRSD